MIAVVRLAFTAWLIYAAWADLSRGQVSNWVTIPPLLAVIIGRLTIPGGWVVGLCFVFILVAAQWPRLIYCAMVGISLCLWSSIPAGLDMTIWVWTVCFVLWRIGVIGGADAKIAMVLTALFPDERLAWLLLASWFVWNVGVLLLKFRDRAPQSLLRAADGLAHLRVSGDEMIRYPAMPAIALGGLVYLWFYLKQL